MYLLATSLICTYGLFLFEAFEQNYFMSFENPLLGVYYPNDIVQCNARQWFSSPTNVSSTNIVIRRILRNNTKVILAMCPIRSDEISAECKANFSANGCKDRVKISCSVETNETETERTLGISITGKPSRLTSFRTRYQGVENDRVLQKFPPGTLIELICEGEVPLRNGNVFQNVALCQHNDYHKSKTLRLQEPAMYRTWQISDDGCIGNQTASAFIHLHETQLKTLVICETGYLGTFPKCGNGSHRKTITLQAEEDLNRIYGPFVVTKDVIGNRSLLSMTCYTTIGTFHAETSQHIRWCTRTGKDKHFHVLPLQEKPKEEIFKTSFGIKFKSSVLYQLSKNLKNVEIICETNFSSECGSGSVQERVFLNNDTHDYNWEISSNRNSTQLYFGIGGMVIGVTLIFLTVLIFVKTWNKGGNKEMYKEDSSASNEGPQCVNSIKPSSKESEIPIPNVHQQQSQEQLLEEMMLPTGESSAVLNTDRVQCESMYSHINADIYDLVSYSKTEDHIYERQEVVLKQVETNE